MAPLAIVSTIRTATTESCTHRRNVFPASLKRWRGFDQITLVAELEAIHGEDDYMPIGEVPGEWCDRRLMGECRAEGNYADVYASGWIGYLRQQLASDCLKLGIKDLDASVLQQGQPRRLTQLASLAINRANLAGTYYRSRYGHDLENWALFEPFQIRSRQKPVVIDRNDLDLQAACKILGLRFATAP
jgi:hypothetical protein